MFCIRVPEKVNFFILFQGEGSVGGAAQDQGQGQERGYGQGLGQGPVQNSVQPPHHVQQPGHPEDSLLDLDVLPVAPVSSGDESFHPVSSSSQGSHGAVGEVLMPGIVALLVGPFSLPSLALFVLCLNCI